MKTYFAEKQSIEILLHNLDPKWMFVCNTYNIHCLYDCLSVCYSLLLSTLSSPSYVECAMTRMRVIETEHIVVSNGVQWLKWYTYNIFQSKLIWMLVTNKAYVSYTQKLGSTRCMIRFCITEPVIRWVWTI